MGAAVLQALLANRELTLTRLNATALNTLQKGGRRPRPRNQEAAGRVSRRHSFGEA